METGDGVRAKTGRHKGRKGHVVHDLGHQRVYHVYFPGYGLSYQPAGNLDPDHDGDVDTSGGSDPDHDPVSASAWEALMAQLQAAFHVKHG
jgi:hypothetical protein